jgi:hypothetical protein
MSGMAITDGFDADAEISADRRQNSDGVVKNADLRIDEVEMMMISLP